jgi:hypothetical protein
VRRKAVDFSDAERQRAKDIDDSNKKGLSEANHVELDLEGMIHPFRFIKAIWVRV